MLTLTVNGQENAFDDQLTVDGLVRALGLEPRKVAIERNREIVPKSAYEAVALSNGDIIEIVHFVGGG